MRAVYFPQGIHADELELSGTDAHHFLNVLRLKQGDQVLGLDGKGTRAELTVSATAKKSISFKLYSKKLFEKQAKFDLAVAQVKKEAMDLVLKESCELGFDKIMVLETDHSQHYKLNLERANKLLISGIEQANNLFLPELSQLKLNDLDISVYENIVLFSTLGGKEAKVDLRAGKTLVVIGPEGGFSADEEKFLKNLSEKVSPIMLQTNIMRTPTAISCAVGYCLGALS